MSRERTNMAKLLFTLHNLGCKVNSYEAQAVEQMLTSAGYEEVPFTEKADIFIINTCTVTAVADKKSRQMLHRAKKLNPDALVIAMGCYAEMGKERLLRDNSVDIIVGNNRKKDLLKIIEDHFSKKDNEEITFFDDISKKAPYEELKVCGTVSHTRAFLKVQDGCNRFCSYCIIPYARGRIRSRDIENAVDEIKRLADSGIKEVVLTGIHLSSYGIDLPEDITLANLIERASKVKGIERIRLGSLEAGIITEDFLKRISGVENLCPHFHLSLQSGCDETLKRMNRRYTTDEFYEKCCLIRKYFDRPALTTDVIAGFPGETDEEFEKSIAFVEKVGFFETHIFPYSKREGTPAAKMEDQVSESVKKVRVARLLELNEKQMAKYLESGKGKKYDVLFEEMEERNGHIYWIGHTVRYEKVYYESSEDLKNKTVSVLM